jgi:hypothetical protein
MQARMWICAFVCVASMQGSAKERLIIAASPANALAPASVSVRVLLEPDMDNRLLEICADSPEFYRSSQFQLDGDRAPHVVWLQFPQLPGGEYEIRAVLFDVTGRQTTRAATRVTVR